MTARWLIPAALVIAGTVHQAAAVRQVKSLYTVIDLKSCKTVKGSANGEAWSCGGLPDYPVFVAEGDLKTYLSVGGGAELRRAATQTLRSINTVFEANSNRAAVEWRFIIREGKTLPYATIVRYFTRSGTRRGEVLVVMRVTEKEACHVAYIDAVANTDAIVLARRIADERARAFNCTSEPAPVGAVGKSPM